MVGPLGEGARGTGSWRRERGLERQTGACLVYGCQYTPNGNT